MDTITESGGRRRGETGHFVAAGYCYPHGQEWPVADSYWDVFWVPPICEFTVMEAVMNTYAWGYLAASQRD